MIQVSRLWRANLDDQTQLFDADGKDLDVTKHPFLSLGLDYVNMFDRYLGLFSAGPNNKGDPSLINFPKKRIIN